MAKKKQPTIRRAPANQRRSRASFAEMVGSANRRAHDTANRRADSRADKFIWSVIGDAVMDDEVSAESWEGIRRLLRWSLALLLLPLCWVTTWTFLSRFSQATVDQNFWSTAEFWYFATGALVMVGWFWSGLLKSTFLYLYVLGHELTHAVFVVLFRGKVTEFHVSSEGGYITTNKTNLVIALSPYFIPFWSVIAAISYTLLRYCAHLDAVWDRGFYAAIGFTWTFHMAWTVWMIPRDQPDLKENGTLLSLVIIYLANLLVLVTLLCVASRSPLASSREFAMEWLRYAATSGDQLLRWSNEAIGDFIKAGRF